MNETTADEINATCSAELGSISEPGSFIAAELMSPMTATTTPGQRPAMVVASTVAGMKKMNVTRDWVMGNISQCSAAATAASATANAKRRIGDFSIHGQSRARRKSWVKRGARGLP